MTAQENELVEVGAGPETESAAKRNAGNGKSAQQLLSFRSRKLLKSNVSKASVANNVDKRAAAAVALSSTTELRHHERIGTHSKVLHAEPASAKARRTLWDPRGIENDSAKSPTISQCQQSTKVERNSPIKDERVVEDSAQSDDGVVMAVSKQQLKTPKFKLLETFYEGLEAACCLLRIRRQMCTFRAVCKIVESMSKRRFLLKHLAQIKHIFSEVVHLEYVRCQDPDTWGERWDLRITLLPLSSDCPHTSSPLKGSAGQTAQTIRRRKEFHARLLKFESSHPENGDIPLEPLPRRPNSSTSSSLAASPPRYRMSESNLSGQDDIPESSAQLSAAEPPPKIPTEEFEFSIVKPSHGHDTVELAGTSHFFPSFRPFYSSIQTAQIVDGVAVRRSEVGQSSGTVPLNSHFPASFRPSFSARPSSEAVDGLSKTPTPEETLVASCCEVKHEVSRVESQSGCRGGILPSSSVSVNPSSPLPPSTPVLMVNSNKLPSSSAKSSSPSPPSTPIPIVNSKELPSPSANSLSPFVPSTPIPTAKSKALPSGSTDKSCSELQLDDVPVTPVPIHTPPFQSPMDKSFSSNQESSYKSPCEIPLTNSLRDPEPPKSHGIMRSLRFASPVRGSPPVKANDSDISRTDSLGLASCSVDTPASDGSRMKFVHASASTPSTRANILPGAPETPSLQTPLRSAHSKEIWYSPPKRTKLNQRSLFTNDNERHQEPCISGSTIAVARESCPEAANGRLRGEQNYTEGPQEENSIPSMLHPTAKGGITESDLDVMQCLPHDIVQSVWEKERKLKDDSSKELAKQKRRQQMMSGVPKLFNQLRLIFQSLNRTVLPQHELVKTLLASHPEITDKVEIEERLKLVIELAPDYIHTRPSHSSELLYRIDKRADVAQIQRRLSGRSDQKF